MELIKKGLTLDEKNQIKKIDYERICKKCGIKQSLIKFSCKKEKNGLYYFNYTCNKCEYKRKLKMHNGSIISYNATQTYKENFTIEGRASMLRNRCKQRAKKYNYDFSLTKEYIISLLENGVCEKTNIKLIIDDSTYHPYAPSIDRIDNNKGYTNDNIQVTCMIYNFCKNKFSEEQVNEFFKDMRL